MSSKVEKTDFVVSWDWCAKKCAASTIPRFFLKCDVVDFIFHFFKTLHSVLHDFLSSRPAIKSCNWWKAYTLHVSFSGTYSLSLCQSGFHFLLQFIISSQRVASLWNLLRSISGCYCVVLQNENVLGLESRYNQAHHPITLVKIHCSLETLWQNLESWFH